MSTPDPLQPHRARLIGRRAQRAPGAVALKHQRSRGSAPKVVAKGNGQLAERIVALALEADVPVTRDRNLLELLAHTELGEEIPAELYQAVAELLHYLYRLDGSLSAAA